MGENSPNTGERKLKNLNTFLWGGKFGWLLLRPGRAEQNSRVSWTNAGCLPSNRHNLGPDSGQTEDGVVVFLRTRTHTRGITALQTMHAHMALGKNQNLGLDEGPKDLRKSVLTFEAPSLKVLRVGTGLKPTFRGKTNNHHSNVS